MKGEFDGWVTFTLEYYLGRAPGLALLNDVSSEGIGHPSLHVPPINFRTECNYRLEARMSQKVTRL